MCSLHTLSILLYNQACTVCLLYNQACWFNRQRLEQICTLSTGYVLPLLSWHAKLNFTTTETYNHITKICAYSVRMH